MPSSHQAIPPNVLSLPWQSSVFPGRVGEPRIEHDPLSTEELLVWLIMDSHIPEFVRPKYLDPFPGPGYVDPRTKLTLYANFQCVAIREKDRQYIEVCYRLLPSAYVYSWDDLTNVPLPDVLTGLVVTFNTASGDGQSEHPATQQGAVFNGVGSGSVYGNPKGRAQASASVMPEVIPTIVRAWDQKIRAKNYIFQLLNPATMEQMLARITLYLVSVGYPNFAFSNCTISNQTAGVVTDSSIQFSNGMTVMVNNVGGQLPTGLSAGVIYYTVNAAGHGTELALTPNGTAINTTGTQSGQQQVVIAVNPFPVFNMKTLSISLFGQQCNVAADAETAVYASVDSNNGAYSSSYDYGSGHSNDTSVTNKTLIFPPTLHGAIGIGQSSETVGPITASVDASSNAIVQGTNTLVTAITNTISETVSAAGVVAPATFSATSPMTIPTAGIYLVDINVTVHDDQLLFVHGVTVDFSNFTLS